MHGTLLHGPGLLQKEFESVEKEHEMRRINCYVFQFHTVQTSARDFQV